MADSERALAGVLFLGASTNAMDVYSAVNSSPWTAENVTAGDPEKESSLRRYCLHAIANTIFIDGIAAYLANGLWWAVVSGALIQVIYMTWLYYDAVRRGRITKASSFEDNWSGEDPSKEPGQGQFAGYPTPAPSSTYGAAA